MNEDQLYTAVLALFQTAKRVPHRFAYKLRSGTLTGTGISPLSFCVHEPPDARGHAGGHARLERPAASHPQCI